MVLKLALALLAVLIVLTVLVRLFEARLAFFPVTGETATPRDFGVEYDTWSIATADGERLRAWVLRPDAPGARIVYFHGNGGNLSIWAPILAGIARRGYSVLVVDYRGYGSSTGRPTERGVYRDVDAVVDRFWSSAHSGTPVVYWGRSLGTVMAAYAATRRAPDGLILESGFPDARSLVRSSPLMALLSLFSSLRFPAAAFLQRVRVPVLAIHGDDDHVIPIEQGRRLFEGIAGRKEFFTIRGGDHNDVAPPDPRVYWEAVEAFVAGLRGM